MTAVELVDRGVEQIGELEHDPLLQAQLLQTLAGVNSQLGRYDEASTLVHRAVEIRRSRPPDSTLVSALNAWGQTFIRRGLPDSAAIAIGEALPLSIDLLGEEHDESLALMNNLAIVYGRLGRDEDAEATLRKVVELEARAFEPDDPTRTYALNNLGLQLTGDDRFAEAEALLRESLRIRVAASGEDDLATAAAMDNLGMVLREAGRYDEAEPLMRQAMATRRAFLGEEHRDTGESLYALGTLLALRAGPGDLSEADSLLNAELDIYTATLGADHPGTAYLLHSLGVLAEQRVDLREAERRFRDALRIRRSAARDNPAVTVMSLTALARVLRARGSREATAGAEEGMELARTELPGGHPHRAEARAELGLALVAAGRPGGRDHLAEGLSGLADALGRAHPRVRRICADAHALNLDPPAPCGAVTR